MAGYYLVLTQLAFKNIVTGFKDGFCLQLHPKYLPYMYILDNKLNGYCFSFKILIH